MRKNNEQDYYLGLDIGTNSVGYAVTDKNYNLLRFKSEPMIGTHLFDVGNQAAERRTFRSARRRLNRKKQRIRWTQELFAKEIAKVDVNFYRRIQESALLAEDKSNPDDPNSLFSNEYQDSIAGQNVVYSGDAAFHKKYPTIHHLIVDLMNTDEKRDIRLVYIACAWLVTHRGHFLNEIDGDSIDKLTNFSPLYKEFMDWFTNKGVGLPWELTSEQVEAVMSKREGISKKKASFAELFQDGKLPQDNKDTDELSSAALIGLLCGSKIKVSDIFIADEDLSKNDEKISFNMDEEEFEIATLQLGPYKDLLDIMKKMYNCAFLKDLLSGNDSISEAKVKIYEKHKKDLRELKALIKKYVNNKYSRIFRDGAVLKDEKKKNEGYLPSYTTYVGNYKYMKGGEKKPKCSPEDLYKVIRTVFEEIGVKFPKGNQGDERVSADFLEEGNPDLKWLQTMHDDMSALDFLPKQTNSNNGILPQQLQYAEMKKVLENASKHYGFLNETDEDELTVMDKLLSIFQFRIPYFVGPLNRHSKYSWVERKKEKAKEKILPWNIEDVVNYKRSEEEFIDNMTNNCTYLPNEKVLPRWSLLYSEFTVLNEINNISIDGELIDVALKQKLYKDYFLDVDDKYKKKKVTIKDIEEFLLANSNLKRDDKGRIKGAISGINKTVKSSVRAAHDFRRLLNSKTLNKDDVEEIIKQSTYTASRPRFKKWLSENYNLDESDLNYVSKLKYSDFGKLSERLLNGIVGMCKETGEIGTVMHFLYETNDNLMQIIGTRAKYTFYDVIKEENEEFYNMEMTMNERLDMLGVSNAVKRPVIRAMDVVSDIVKAKGRQEPVRIFVEMARDASGDQKGKETESRETQLKKLYESIKRDSERPDVREDEKEHIRKMCGRFSGLGDAANRRLQNQKLYLYYLQVGKCMYCGEEIEVEHLNQNEYCDIDHIWPKSRVKDESLLNNKVLVHSVENRSKSNSYPLTEECRSRMRGTWAMLHKQKLMTDVKYNRLIRNYGFTNDEKLGFINRQLVETRQATKAITELLQQKYPKSEIVFVKARLISDFRHQYGSIKKEVFGEELININEKEMRLVKCRSINDLHHAKDAYLSIVVGNVYHEKFTKNFTIEDNEKYSINETAVFGRETENSNAWIPEEHLLNVDRAMANNHIHLTKYQVCKTEDGFFDQMPLKASDSDALFPRKQGLDTRKYGGYNGKRASFFTLVKITTKTKKEVRFVAVDNLEAEQFKNNEQYAMDYVRRHLESQAKSLAKGKIEFLTKSRVIKVNAVILLDGYEVILTKKANKGKEVGIRSMMSLHLTDRHERYVKRIEKVSDKIKAASNGNPYIIDEFFDEITRNRNEELYKTLTNKIKGAIYSKRPGAHNIKVGEEEESAFKDMSLENQVKELEKLCLLLKTNDPKMPTLQANVSNWAYQDVRIINRSSSGLFEQRSQNLKELL